VKGKETARAHLIFLKGWCEIQGEKKKRKKQTLLPSLMYIRGACHLIALGTPKPFKHRLEKQYLVA
jgi:hypothetical protein